MSHTRNKVQGQIIPDRTLGPESSVVRNNVDEQVVLALVQRLDDRDFSVRGSAGSGIDALWNLVADRP